MYTGYEHSLFLCANGDVYGCGSNEYGQCGIKDAVTLYLPPQKVPVLKDIVDIKCGSCFNLCLDKIGKVWGFGRNSYSQLGLGEEYETIDTINTVVINPYLEDIMFVACGYDFGLCIDKDGKAFTFGRCTSGECGIGVIATQVSVPFCLQSKEYLKDIIIGSGSCGSEHTVLITADNDSLCGYGSNRHHETGNVSTTAKQLKPHKITKKDIGIEENVKIVRVICSQATTLIICEE